MDLNKIYNEDCLNGMQSIPYNSVDCIICDLPYGTTRNHWDSIIPLDKLWIQYERIIKTKGAIVLFSQMPFTAVLAYSNLKMLKYEIVWIKDNSTGFLNCNFAPMKTHENILVFSKSSACFVKNKDKAMIFNPQMIIGEKPYICNRSGKGSSNYDCNNLKSVSTINHGERYPIDVVTFKRDKEKIHPTQKPVNLVRYLIRTYTNSGDIILDNCIGSGTTAIAAIREKRKFIGFELDKGYYEKACGRIKAEMEKYSLF